MSPADKTIAVAKIGSPDWDQLSHAERVARAIMADCLDRRGIGGELSACDDDIIQEILDAWVDLYHAA